MWTLGATEKEWFVSNRYYPELDDSKLRSIFYFSLIWNIYEKELCDKYAHIQTHPDLHSQKYHNQVDQNILDSVFEYFKKRYILDGQPTDLFKAFKFEKSPVIKNEVLEYLKSEELSSENKLTALLYIAFRLRNNLFHGEKAVFQLYDQNENFRQINLLLMHLIDSSDRASRNQALDELTATSQELGMGY